MNDVPPGRAERHRLERVHERRRLPVALATEAVAVGHQPLDGQTRELAQPTEVLEVGRERSEPAVTEELTESGLDARAASRSESARSPPGRSSSATS